MKQCANFSSHVFFFFITNPYRRDGLRGSTTEKIIPSIYCTQTLLVAIILDSFWPIRSDMANFRDQRYKTNNTKEEVK